MNLAIVLNHNFKKKFFFGVQNVQFLTITRPCKPNTALVWPTFFGPIGQEPNIDQNFDFREKFMVNSVFW